MFCNKCGAENASGSKFCNNCGNRFDIVQMDPAVKARNPKMQETLDALNLFATEGGDVTAAYIEKTGRGYTSIPASQAAKERLAHMEEQVTAPIEGKANDENPLSQLSSYRKTEPREEKKAASMVLNPIDDPYWDDTVKEIDDTLHAISPENVLKVIGCIFAVFAVIAWFIYML